MQNVIYKFDFFSKFSKKDLKKGPEKVTRKNLQKLPAKNLVLSNVNTGSYPYTQKEQKPSNPMFTVGNLKLQKK